MKNSEIIKAANRTTQVEALNRISIRVYPAYFELLSINENKKVANIFWRSYNTNVYAMLGIA